VKGGGFGLFGSVASPCRTLLPLPWTIALGLLLPSSSSETSEMSRLSRLSESKPTMIATCTCPSDVLKCPQKRVTDAYSSTTDLFGRRLLHYPSSSELARHAGRASYPPVEFLSYEIVSFYLSYHFYVRLDVQKLTRLGNLAINRKIRA
jgi:hypothetical protein